MPEATGRSGSSSRIAEVIVLVHSHAASALSASPMQLHSLPSSQHSIALQSFISRTNRRTNRVSNWSASGSVIGFLPASAGGTNKVPLIQPVTIPTTKPM